MCTESYKILITHQFTMKTPRLLSFDQMKDIQRSLNTVFCNAIFYSHSNSCHKVGQQFKRYSPIHCFDTLFKN